MSRFVYNLAMEMVEGLQPPLNWTEIHLIQATCLKEQYEIFTARQNWLVIHTETKDN